MHFKTQLQQFQFYDKYSRFNYETGTRENWKETVIRSTKYLRQLSNNLFDEGIYDEIYENILGMQVSPSMRLLAMAGPAADKNNIRIYNCSYQPIDCIDAIVESLIISMNGCGVGYSVEQKYIDKFPRVKVQKGTRNAFYQVEDSSEGWAHALRLGLEHWFAGENVEFDFSLLRPAGAPLKTKGGQSSGPEALISMLRNIQTILLKRQGEFLSSLDVHDIVCHVGSCAVSGGTRRTAMISLFDFDDKDMRHCKDGDLLNNQQRWNSNNSAVFTNRQSDEDLVLHLQDMFKSQRGEPGIFSRSNAIHTRPERRLEAEFGTNPCGEVVLRPNEFCNLSICVAREDDTFHSLINKVRLATIIGTIQSTATYFPGLRNVWKDNCEDERLLGVDITGQRDCDILNNNEFFKTLKATAIEVNKWAANILGIKQSAAVTCVKPSGNSAQLFNCSSGIHGRWSEYYIRNIRISAHSPLFKVLQDAGVPMNPENGQTAENAITWVIPFPVKSPSNAAIASKLSAIQQLDYWKVVKTNYAEHSVSNTISYKEDEINDIILWVLANKDIIGGLTFLPVSNAKYDQMPYVAISRFTYEKLLSEFPQIDFTQIKKYESTDHTRAAQELACSSGYCEL